MGSAPSLKSGNLPRLLGLLVIAAFYVVIPNARPDFSVFNCHDSESYLALSHSLAHGRGYTRSMIPGAYIGHTTWPPGVPLLMLPAVTLSGAQINWLAVKLTMVAVGLVGVILTWHLGARLSGRRSGGDFAAVAVALNPFYWDFSHQAMAEVPLTVWIIGSLVLIDHVWAGRQPRAWHAMGVGVVCGLGMLFKGHAIGLALVPAAYLVGRQASATTLTGRGRVWMLFVLGFAIPLLVLMVRNSFVEAPGFDGINQIHMIRAKDPVDETSALLTLGETLAVLKVNLLDRFIYRIPSQVLPFLWYEPAYEWDGSGLIFLALTAAIVLAAAPWRYTSVLGLHLVGLPIFALNIQYALGGSARFWVPVSIVVAILLAIRLEAAARTAGGRPHPLVFGGFVLVMAASVGGYVWRHEQHPYQRDDAWREKAQLFESVARLAIRSVGVYTSNAHAFQLITGLPAPMRADLAVPVDHVILDLRSATPATGAPFTEVASEPPWALYRLPHGMSIRQAQALIAGKPPRPAQD